MWHDRAVFHFLTAPEDRAAYVQNVLHAVKPGGHVIVSTFGPEGPTKCSGLEAMRYDAESLQHQFGAQFRLVDGYRRLVDRLAFGIEPARYKLFRSTIVQRIAWRRGRVRLATDGGDFLAERALITVPIGVLRATSGSAGAIAFDPDPPSLRRALAGLAMGDVAKLVLRFREPFWRQAPRVARARSSPGLCGNEPNFFHFPSAPFPTWWTSAPVEAPVLTAWAGATAAAGDSPPPLPVWRP